MQDKAQFKAKFSRIANDRSQLEQFKNDFIDGKALIAAFAPADVDSTKVYVLQAVNGVISFVQTD